MHPERETNANGEVKVYDRRLRVLRAYRDILVSKATTEEY